MKQIFDWLREQTETLKEKADVQRKKAMEEKATNFEFYEAGRIYAFDDMIELINEAEAKWEADYCEWKPHIADKEIVEAHNFLHIKDNLFDWEFCPYCGKRIKIVEVE